eukprot:2694676-Amphidinium_carterae.1
MSPRSRDPDLTAAQCPPKVRAQALVERLVSGHPAKSESLQATTSLGIRCLGQAQTTKPRLPLEQVA